MEFTMKKIITSLVLASTLLSVGVAQARGGHHGGGNDFGRFVGYTAAAALTVGAVSYVINSGNNNSYNRGYNDSYRNQVAAREQAQYDYEMSRRYQPQPVYYQQPAYYAPPAVYYAPPVRQQVIYVNGPTYYNPPIQRVYYNSYYP